MSGVDVSMSCIPRCRHARARPAHPSSQSASSERDGLPGRARQRRRELHSNLAQIDARAEFGLDRLLPAVLVRDFDDIYARILVELVKFEVAVVVTCRLSHDSAVLEEPHTRALDAVDDAVRFGRDRSANEAFRVAPEIAIIDPRLRGEFGTHHLESFV